MSENSPSESGGTPPNDDLKREIKHEIAAAIEGQQARADKPKTEEEKKKEIEEKHQEAEKKKKEQASAARKEKVVAFMKQPVFYIPAAVVGAILLFLVWHHAHTHESTDDAYTNGHIHNISSRVTGTVLEVLVDDNEKVAKDQILLRLDPSDYQVKVDQARADYAKAKADWDRIQPLQGDEAISQQDFDQAEAALRVAKAQLEDAQNQLSYCTIKAPADGRIGRKQVEAGNRVTVGGALMAVVEDIWVVANYKETQLGRIKVGQPVAVEIDAIPGKKFTGTVDSFAPGSGSTFALLPSDNATGNFTKIVQRVPVKIVFDADSVRGYDDRLVPGLSCIPSIDTGVDPKLGSGSAPVR